MGRRCDLTRHAPLEDLLRELAPRVLGVLVRHYGHFDEAEEAVQEALLAAAMQWPRDGTPDSPQAWLTTVATRRMTDQLRSDDARRRREEADAARVPRADLLAPPADDRPLGESEDDTLALVFMCCHPALSAPAQVALTLRAVGGLTTAEIARALFVPETTLAQRISRAKQRIRSAGVTFELPTDDTRAARLGVVLQVLYLIFNEGYTATSGELLHRRDLATEAIRLTRLLHQLLPGTPEVSGLLALMLLTDARQPARTTPDGRLVPLADQDRTRWDSRAIDEGVALLSSTLVLRRPGPYQLQAAIAAVHDEAQRADDTDWPQIAALYAVLDRLTANPIVTVNRAVAVAMVHGAAAGLALLDTVPAGTRTVVNHRFTAVRAHLLEQAGDIDAALDEYGAAARLTSSIPERRYLLERAAHLHDQRKP